MPKPFIVKGSVEALEQELAELEAAQDTGGEGVVTEEVVPIAPEEDVTPPTPLSPEEENWKKRYSDLRSHSQKQINELKARMKELEENKPSEAIPTNPEKIKEWAEKNPQAAAIIRSIAGEQANKEAAKINKQVEELARDKQEAAIRRAHEDFDDIIVEKAFHDWVDTQPEFVQDLVYVNGNSKDVIWVLDNYKLSLEKPRNKDKDAAVAVKTKGTRPAPVEELKGRFKESDILRNSDQWYMDHEKEIDEARRNGTFVYDVSGGAR